MTKDAIKQKEVLSLILKGIPIKEIAKQKGMALNKVYKARDKLYRKGMIVKLGVHKWSLTQKGNLMVSEIEFKKNPDCRLSDEDLKNNGTRIIIFKLEKIEERMHEIEKFLGYKKELSKKIKRTPPKWLRTKFLSKYNLTCQICGFTVEPKDSHVMHLDHIIPISKGGRTEESNLQLVCPTCNTRKGTKIYS